MSAFGGKADIGLTPQQCPLLTQSGRQRLKIAAAQLDPEPHSVGHKSLL
jgi:hypothetical protein